MESIIIILGVVWGILGIILFFKIWKAADDIAEIKRAINQKALSSIPQQSVSISPAITATPVNKNKEHASNPPVQTSVKFKKRMVDLKTHLNNIEGREEKFKKLNDFLNNEYKSLKSTTLPENKNHLAQTWGLILMEIEPLYKSIDKTIPWAFEQYKY